MKKRIIATAILLSMMVSNTSYATVDLNIIKQFVEYQVAHNNSIYDAIDPEATPGGGGLRSGEDYFANTSLCPEQWRLSDPQYSPNVENTKYFSKLYVENVYTNILRFTKEAIIKKQGKLDERDVRIFSQLETIIENYSPDFIIKPPLNLTNRSFGWSRICEGFVNNIILEWFSRTIGDTTNEGKQKSVFQSIFDKNIQYDGKTPTYTKGVSAIDEYQKAKVEWKTTFYSDRLAGNVVIISKNWPKIPKGTNLKAIILEQSDSVWKIIKAYYLIPIAENYKTYVFPSITGFAVATESEIKNSIEYLIDVNELVPVSKRAEILRQYLKEDLNLWLVKNNTFESISKFSIQKSWKTYFVSAEISNP